MTLRREPGDLGNAHKNSAQISRLLYGNPVARGTVEKYFPTFLRGLRPGSAGAFAFAFACIELATFARLSLDSVASAAAVPFISYFPAILFATFFGGFWAGWTALVVTIILTWGFLTPDFSFRIPSPTEIGTLAVFTLTASIIVGGAERYRRMLERLNEEERHREMLVRDLEHRMKNKLVTVQAILGPELRDHPELWEKIYRRLMTIVAADEFVARADGKGAHLKDLLKMEFAPYGALRLRTSSDDVFVPAKTATVLALIFHELATNAAKYGALSTPDGSVTVDWKRSGDRVTINWVESDGPPVGAPRRRGFGTSLLERGLDSYRGRTTMRFEPTGLVCAMSLVLPHDDPPLSPFIRTGHENRIGHPNDDVGGARVKRLFGR